MSSREATVTKAESEREIAWRWDQKGKERSGYIGLVRVVAFSLNKMARQYKSFSRGSCDQN